MNTENSITNQKGYDNSLTENSTKHAANADSSYDGLSQDEVRRLQEMAPELRDALLRLRRNIHSRQQEREQEAETRELNISLETMLHQLADTRGVVKAEVLAG